ncbi:MAG: insulinase family protein [Bacteroidales bacterium]|nr:insulinase family protein [Bacteroidales bacterium]
MINFEKFTLENGLKVIVHRDTSTPIVSLNILYDVGARDEQPDKTGFAHLFEHLMFGGSVNIPKYDTPLEKAGGENNAFTTNDITNYYLTIPKPNLELGFWLESDRMFNLAFSEKSLEVQRQVVIEEFKQRYLNQPYGDVWLLLRPLVYTKHPYQWPTIGKEITHIENASMDDVKAFYKKFYNPSNAILSVAGDVTVEEIRALCQKWFAPIENHDEYTREILPEPKQEEARFLSVERNVPYDTIYKAYHMGKRTDSNYHCIDLISDILSNGDSSRLFIELVKNQKLFTSINAYISGDCDNGLFIVNGKLAKNGTMEQAEAAIIRELEKIKSELPDERELQKVKNKCESLLEFSELKVSDKAYNLAYYELLGDANLNNLEVNKYQAVSAEDVCLQAKELFKETNCSTLHYLSNQK